MPLQRVRVTVQVLVHTHEYRVVTGQSSDVNDGLRGGWLKVCHGVGFCVSGPSKVHSLFLNVSRARRARALSHGAPASWTSSWIWSRISSKPS